MFTALATYGYIGLFIASFLASTILPLASEAVFSVVVCKADAMPFLCVIIATAGNTLGSLTCYWIGTIGKLEWIKKLGAKQEDIDKAVRWIQHKGIWICLLSFLPIVGDAIAIAAGYVRCNIVATTTLFAIGKFLRYIVWMYVHNMLF